MKYEDNGEKKREHKSEDGMLVREAEQISEEDELNSQQVWRNKCEINVRSLHRHNSKDQ